MASTVSTRKVTVVPRDLTRDDENKDNKNSKVGDLPEGLYNEDTKIFFCCSTSGSANKEIVLPNKSPFLLFAYDSILCQKVSN